MRAVREGASWGALAPGRARRRGGHNARRAGDHVGGPWRHAGAAGDGDDGEHQPLAPGTITQEARVRVVGQGAGAQHGARAALRRGGVRRERHLRLPRLRGGRPRGVARIRHPHRGGDAVPAVRRALREPQPTWSTAAGAGSAAEQQALRERIVRLRRHRVRGRLRGPEHRGDPLRQLRPTLRGGVQRAAVRRRGRPLGGRRHGVRGALGRDRGVLGRQRLGTGGRRRPGAGAPEAADGRAERALQPSSRWGTRTPAGARAATRCTAGATAARARWERPSSRAPARRLARRQWASRCPRGGAPRARCARASSRAGAPTTTGSSTRSRPRGRGP